MAEEISKQELREEVRFYIDRAKKQEERAERAEQENKQLRNTLVEIGFDRFSEAEMWRITADALASELEHYKELYTQKEIELKRRKNSIKYREGERNFWWNYAGELEDQLRELFEAVRPHANVSKHVYRECEGAEQLLEKHKEDTDG